MMNCDTQNSKKLHKSTIPEQFMPFSCTELRDDQIVYARERLNETEETKRESLPRIKRFINKELDFFSEFDDIIILNFLRTCSFDFEKTCNLMKNIAEFCKNHQDYFSRIDTDIISRVIASKAVIVLPYRDAKGRAIILIQAENWDPDDLKAEDIIFGSIIAFHKCVENPMNQVEGYVVIISCKDFYFKQFAEISTWLLFGIHNLQKSCPVIVSEIHVLYTPTLIHLCWRIVEPILNLADKQKIKFYDSSNWESFYKKIPPCILPEEIGGQLELEPHFSEYWANDIPMTRESFFDLVYKGESD